MPFVKCADCIRAKEKSCSSAHPIISDNGCFCGATEGIKSEQIGKKCGECAHFSRCESIFGVNFDYECNFYPSRFMAKKE